MQTSLKVVGSALALGVCSVAGAADVDVRSQLEQLQAKVNAQETEIQQLRAANGESWLTERRASEVKALVREVLADADTRASLADGGVSAGYKGGNFFLASEDGNFLLKVNGQLQVRYSYNKNDGGAGANVRENEEGFDIRRAVLSFSGHLFDPKFTYQISLIAQSNDHSSIGTVDEGDVGLQNAWFAYEFADGWQVKAGQFKAPFLRDEAVHSSRQLAVERAIITDNLTVDYTQGVQLGYTADMFRVMAMIHDGSYAAGTDAVTSGEGEVDFGIAARGEILLAGKWAQFEDYATWSGDSFGLLVGVGVDYESSQGEDNTTNDDVLRWTVDASAEFPELMGLNVMGAVVGNHPQARETLAAGDSEPEQFAFLVQAGIFVIPDKMDVFGRFEYIDLDDNSFNSTGAIGAGNDDTQSIITVGTNYYFKKHAAKATLDVVWMLDTTSDTGLSFNGSSTRGSLEDDEFAIRAQFQVLF